MNEKLTQLKRTMRYICNDFQFRLRERSNVLQRLFDRRGFKI